MVEVDALDGIQVFGSEANDIAHLMVVDPPDKGWNQHGAGHMSQAKVLQCLKLLGKYVATPDGLIRSGCNPVELEIDGVQAASFQSTAQIEVLCQDQSVRGNLDLREAHLPGQGNDFRQVLPQCGFAPGELDRRSDQ